MPSLTFAQTKDMTDTPQEDIVQEEKYSDQALENNEWIEQESSISNEQESSIWKKPLPIVSEAQKAKRTTTEIENKEEVKLNTTFTMSNVDTQRVQKAWRDMINSVRSEKAWDYSIDTKLVATSTERANYLGKNRKFSKMHQRPGQKCSNYRCYDLDGRFSTRDVSASAWESIGYWWYSCSKDDCTDALIEASKKTFRFFMSEAKRNWPHYQMVVSGKYSKFGVGIAETKASWWKAYVLVLHVSP